MFRKYDRSGPDLNPRKVTEHARNKGILQSEPFVLACELAGIEPSLRQASKFKMSKGKAFMFKNEALVLIKSKETKND